jgi:hypothetical protein
VAAVNESAASLLWLRDGLGESLTAAWADVRTRMRVPDQQVVMFATDWISDPWVAKGLRPADVVPTATPMYDPPDDVHAWPDFKVQSSLSAVSVPFVPTRHDSFDDLVSTSRAGGDDAVAATEEFMASQQLIASHGDEHMIFGDQVRAWILASVGSLLRGLAFAPRGIDEDVIAAQAVARVAAPIGFTLPNLWALSNRFGDRHLELLLNLTVEADGTFTPLDPADLRIGQGLPWQMAWRWLSMDVPKTLVVDAIQLAARMLRNRGLRLGLLHAVTSSDAEVRTLATGVLRRWGLTLKSMAWAEHALGQPWEVVRPADIACFAFSATKPEWPRRLVAISHRSFEVKPKLRHMGLWKSSRCAIDATYLPSWETNTGMIWGLFAATPALVRVRTHGYEESVWCRREAEMIGHLRERADYFAGRCSADIELDQLATLDEWEVVVRGKPRDAFSTIQPEFPAFGLTVWSPRPAPPWELAVLRAAGALRAISSFIGDAATVNGVVDQLRLHGDFPLPPAPTNHPGAWRSYAAIFQSVDALTNTAPTEPGSLRLPDAYSTDDMARDREIANLIPDLRSGSPSLDDILVAVEFLRTIWPLMVDQGRGRFLVLNLQGLSYQQWKEDPSWSLHRGLASLRGLPVPLWFLQGADQGLSDWGLVGDPPILTEHVDAQFGWMLEAHPDVAEWRARYPDDSGLDVSAALRSLHQPAIKTNA